jgi:hypothetical protein
MMWVTSHAELIRIEMCGGWDVTRYLHAYNTHRKRMARRPGLRISKW